MKEIILLETHYDYEFRLEGERIGYACYAIHPNFNAAKPLLEAIKARREEALAYLKWRQQPLNMPEILWAAAEKAERSAQRCAAEGQAQLSRREWQRAARLYAASLRLAGELSPTIPWEEWIESVGRVSIPDGNIEL